jgi:hypothetical protein
MSVVKQSSPAVAHSLYEVAVSEAKRHQWLVSERRGCDCGDWAWREWWECYWPQFCRHRCLEHLRGERNWSEFEEQAFGRFYDAMLQGDLLLDRILDRVAEGWENLHFALWLNEWDLPHERAIEILACVNINSSLRLNPR